MACKTDQSASQSNLETTGHRENTNSTEVHFATGGTQQTGPTPSMLYTEILSDPLTKMNMEACYVVYLSQSINKELNYAGSNIAHKEQYFPPLSSNRYRNNDLQVLST